MTASLVIQQMPWVEGESVVGMEISSEGGLKYCYSLAQQAKQHVNGCKVNEDVTAS